MTKEQGGSRWLIINTTNGASAWRTSDIAVYITRAKAPASAAESQRHNEHYKYSKKPFHENDYHSQRGLAPSPTRGICQKQTFV